MSASCLLVVHDSSRGGQDDVSELTRGEKVSRVLLEVSKLDVQAGRDDGALVETSGEVDDNLARAVVVDDFELTDVTVLHHHGQETDDDLKSINHLTNTNNKIRLLVLAHSILKLRLNSQRKKRLKHST